MGADAPGDLGGGYHRHGVTGVGDQDEEIVLLDDWCGHLSDEGDLKTQLYQTDGEGLSYQSGTSDPEDENALGRQYAVRQVVAFFLGDSSEGLLAGLGQVGDAVQWITQPPQGLPRPRAPASSYP